MNSVLLVGSGGREHAIAAALVGSGDVRLFAASERANPGIAACAEAVLPTERDHGAMIEFCRTHSVDFCVIGPEAPLAAGLTDDLDEAGFPCASPSREAAEIESNKQFMRTLMARYALPGLIGYHATGSVEDAIAYAERQDWRVAIKPLGLTSGKGVKVWGDHFDDALGGAAYVREVIESSVSGHSRVLLEELAIGEEFTLHFYCDGRRAVPSPLIQDHKRAFDGDAGPNTGGMGSYSCPDGMLPFVSSMDYAQAVDIGQRVVDMMRLQGRPFRGILYGQFIVTADGLRVIEFNARFGDPEAINALELLQTPFVDVCKAMIAGELSEGALTFRPVATVVLYVVPENYGVDPKVGEIICVDEAAIRECGATAYFASCDRVDRREGFAVKTTSSRTLAMYAEAPSVDAAQRKTLTAIHTLTGRFSYRSDIGSEASLAKKIARMTSLYGGVGSARAASASLRGRDRT